MKGRRTLLTFALSLALGSGAARADILPQFQGTWFGPCTLTQVDGTRLHFENVACGARVERRSRGAGTSVLTYAEQSIELRDLTLQ